MKLGPNQQSWLAALRSGEYDQVDGTLQAGGSYCCLGVGCVAAASECVDVVYDENGLLGDALDSQEATWNWLGLRTHSGDAEGSTERLKEAVAYVRSLGPGQDIGSTKHSLELVNLNDEIGLTFDEIADLIEKFPDLYFKESK